MDDGDYAFRYPLRHKKRDPVYTHRLVELVRVLLESLLDVVCLTYRGQEVKADGFRFLAEPETTYNIYSRRGPPDPSERGPSFQQYQSLRNASLYEPRIPLIQNVLEALLEVVDLEGQDGLLEVKGFRLKDLQDWVVPSLGDPAEVFAYAATRCNVDCSFCYLKGNPPELALVSPVRRAKDELAEMMTRLRYYRPQSRQALLPAWGEIREALAHPYIVPVLKALRQKTEATFRLYTSGKALTEGMVRELASLRPVYIYLSLHTVSPQRLARLVHRARPHIQLQAPQLLQAYQIPYAVAIVPWPLGNLPETLQDLEETCLYLDRFQPHLFQVHLPGYTKYYSPTPLFDHEEVWRAIVAKVRELRKKLRSPIIAMPTMYEEIRFETVRNQALIVGIVPNSPAYHAGLEAGDVVTAVGWARARNRPQARDLLALASSQEGPVSVSVLRGTKELTLAIDPSTFAYPYSPAADHHLGIVMMGMGFRTGYVEALRDLISRHGARHVLFLSSQLVRPYFEDALQESGLIDRTAIRLDIEVPQNRYFGGNIILGDLLVVQDFIDHIRDYLARGNPRPDLVVIPSTPFGLGAWRRDLTGRPYLDIERETGVPVALLECERIYE